MRINLITKTLLALSLIFCALACQKQEESEVHDTVVIITQLSAKTPATLVSGGSDNITVSATCDWSLQGEDWFTIEPSTGNKGISESTIVTQPNTTGAARVGTIRLKAGKYSGTYTFTQAGE